MLVAVGVLVGEGQASWVVKISAVLKVNPIFFTMCGHEEALVTDKPRGFSEPDQL